MPYSDKSKQAEAARKHYENNKELLKERAKAFNIKARDRVREHILTYLESHPCVDCGESDPIILEFDHRGDKLFEIGAAVQRGFSLPKVEAEIAKCDVRCANCHRRKTYKERGYRHRTRVQDDQPPSA